MTRNEQQMYSDITSIRKSLEKIANALNNNVTQTTKDIPGFEGTLDALDNLCNVRKDDDNVHNDYLNDLVQGMNQIEYLQFHNQMNFSFASNDSTAMSDAIYELEYEECLGAIEAALLAIGDRDYIEEVKCSNLGLGYNEETIGELGREYVKDLLENESLKKDDPYTYDNDLNEYKYVSKVGKIKNDSDFDIRVTAKMYEDDVLANGGTKKDCILDYVTNEFGLHGARYTDIIKFAYYLGAHNTYKFNPTDNRGYYAMAFASRYGGHLIQGGKDYLVKGINKEGKERYFAHSSVDSFTDYYKEIS